MSTTPVLGRVHSIQTLGTLDGPGVRFVVFTQGCPLRCGCCHNPDTWQLSDGTEISAQELATRAMRYRAYFGDRGGVTLSGGEPLLQAEFSLAFFYECKTNGLHTCLDTSGAILNDTIKELLSLTDRVLLDVKYPTDELYQRHVGCSLTAPLHFLEQLQKLSIPTTLRQVLIPTLNDNADNAAFLADLKKRYSVIDQIELLPFKKICTVKYDRIGIPFPFAGIDEPTQDEVARIEAMLEEALQKS